MFRILAGGRPPEVGLDIDPEHGGLVVVIPPSLPTPPYLHPPTPPLPLPHQHTNNTNRP
nr:MAG TPA: hypothetical protein [Caudoviricetes sp.]